MKLIHLIVFAAAGAVAAGAQTPAKPAAPTATAKPVSTSAKSATASKLPPGIPPVPGVTKVAFSLRYKEIKIGTGPEAEPNKLYKVNYTGWLAADGKKFDSSADHRQPLTGKDGKPVLDDDGKPKMSDPQPIMFPQGFGRVIPGWDQGFNGMKIGGKRRLFIPWQLAYGAAGRVGPDPAHPVIPPKADLIFDIELVDVQDMPARPGMPPHPGVPNGAVPHAGMPAPPRPGAPAAPPATAASPAPSTPATAPVKQMAAPASPSAAQPATAAAPTTPQSAAQPK